MLKDSRAWIWLVGAVLVLVVLIAVLVVPRLRTGDPAAITVMTRNLYLGADIDRPVRAASGRAGAAALIALGQANHEVRAIVDKTDFGVRSQLLAAEIAVAHPDVIGLQEVALWRSGPLQLDQLGVPNATTVDYDFLQLLLGELERRRLSYDVVQAQEESDVEGPAFTGDPANGTARLPRDVRLTLRDVILVRAGTGISVTDRGSGQYQAALEVSLGGIRYRYLRGYAWADLRIGRTRLRFLTTHLESERADVTLRQADELLAGAAASRPGVTVLACDCNSDPQGPTAAAYAQLTEHGFADAWLAQRSALGPGFTFGFGEDLQDPQPHFSRRLDLVLARGLPPEQLAASRAEVTGDEPADRDPGTGLWPSDHAGVAVELPLRAG